MGDGPANADVEANGDAFGSTQVDAALLEYARGFLPKSRAARFRKRLREDAAFRAEAREGVRVAGEAVAAAWTDEGSQFDRIEGRARAWSAEARFPEVRLLLVAYLRIWRQFEVNDQEPSSRSVEWIERLASDIELEMVDVPTTRPSSEKTL